VDCNASVCAGPRGGFRETKRTKNNWKKGKYYGRIKRQTL